MIETTIGATIFFLLFGFNFIPPFMLAVCSILLWHMKKSFSIFSVKISKNICVKFIKYPSDVPPRRCAITSDHKMMGEGKGDSNEKLPDDLGRR